MRTAKMSVAIGLALTALAVLAAEKVHKQVGEKFQVVLKYQAGTGYQWQLASTPDAAVLKQVDLQYRAPETNFPGAKADQVWSFEAVGKGKATLKFNYVRPLEKSTAPAQTTNVSVVISKAKKRQN